MNTNIEQLEEWLQAPSESEHLEFKEAKPKFSFEKLVKYCCALANERGGRMREFEQVLPELTRTQINRLLRELKEEGRVEFVGAKKTGHWEVAE